MRFFLDSANLDEIKEAADLGILSGVTTNPSLIAKEGCSDILSHIKKICDIVKGPVSVEVISQKSDNMIEEAVSYSKVDENVVIKLPLTKDGIKAAVSLSHMGINTNITLVFSVPQALLAANAGATYVSPFIGRLDDIGYNGVSLVKEIREVYSCYTNITTQIIAASVRNPLHIVEAAKAGADIATVPFKVLMKCFEHHLTDVGIKRFLSDWEVVRKRDE